MKRNETILVYGVTGLLLVILVVAVVFGSDSGTPSASRQRVSSLRNLLEPEAPATKPPPNPRTQAPAQGQPQAQLAGAQPNAGPSVPGGGEPPAGGDGTVPLMAPAGGQPAPQPEVLGKSRRERDYRVVTVQRGDTFRGLVLKWCGSLEQMPLAAALNETLDQEHLVTGQEVCLPWVDDAVLIEAYQERLAAALMEKQQRGAPSDAVGSGDVVLPPGPQPRPALTQPRRDPVPELPLGGGRGEDYTTYTVKHGDSLWAIAARHAGRKQDIPQYIARMRELNPAIAQSDVVRPGGKLKVPKQ